MRNKDDWYKIKVKVNGEIIKRYVSKECVKITDTVNVEEPQANTVETTTTNVEAKTEPTVESSCRRYRTTNRKCSYQQQKMYT